MKGVCKQRIFALTVLAGLLFGSVVALTALLPTVADAAVRTIAPLARFDITATLDEAAAGHRLQARIRQLTPRTAGTLTAVIRFQTEAGQLLAEQPLGVLSFQDIAKEAKLAADIAPEAVPNVGEPVQVFVVLRNDTGLQLAAAYAGTITPKKKPPHFSELKDCDVAVDKATHAAAVRCRLADVREGDVLVAELFAVGKNEPTDTRTQTLTTDQTETELSIPLREPGQYQLRLFLRDADGATYPGTIVRNVVHTGDWVGILYFSGVRFDANTYEATLLFHGSSESAKPRGLYWWILDETDRACVSGHINLQTITPYKRKIAGTLPEDCTDPRFVAALYHGTNPDGSLHILRRIGEADFATLLQEAQAAEKLKAGKLTPEHIFLLLVLIALLYALWRVVVHKENPLAVVLLAGALAASASVTEAAVSAVFTTADNPNVIVTATLTSRTYEPGGDLVFAVSLDDRRAVKTERPAIVAEVPSTGVRTTVFTRQQANAADTISALVRMPQAVPNAEGDYEVRILVPGLCGSAFDYSQFQQARFGTEDCAFTFSFRAEQCEGGTCTRINEPTDPVIEPVGNCVPGKMQTFRFITHYLPDGVNEGNVAFEIAWDDGEQNRIPQTGFLPAGVWRSMQKAWQASVQQYTLRVRVVTDDGKMSNIIARSGACGAVSDTCGDGVLETTKGEQCDDGNTISGDGCSSSCRLEVSPLCGNNVIDSQYGEECDGTDTPAGQQCTRTCRLWTTCTTGMDIVPTQSLVRAGGDARLSWSVPPMVRRCNLLENGTLRMNNAHRVTTYTASGIKGETTFTLECDSICAGETISTSTTIYLAPGWQER